MNGFRVEELPNKGYGVRLNTEIFYGGRVSGSFGLIAARVLGLDYPDYLRFVRDNYNARLYGKEGYTYATYQNRDDCYKVVNLLNKEWQKLEKFLVSKGIEVK